MGGDFLFRTAIVNVAMDVAVLLPLQFVLGGDRKAALATMQEAAICLRLVRWFVVRTTTKREDFLHTIKKLLAHDGRMRALVHFAAVGEVSEVKRVGEQKCYLVFLEWPTAAPAPSACGSRLDAVLKKKIRNIFEPRAIPGVQLKRLAHERRLASARNSASCASIESTCLSSTSVLLRTFACVEKVAHTGIISTNA